MTISRALKYFILTKNDLKPGFVLKNFNDYVLIVLSLYL